MRLPCAVVWDWFRCSSRRLVVVYPSMDSPSGSRGVKQILLIHLHLSQPFFARGAEWWYRCRTYDAMRIPRQSSEQKGRMKTCTVILTASLLSPSQYSPLWLLRVGRVFLSWLLTSEPKSLWHPQFHAQYPAPLNMAQHDHVIDEIFYLTAWGKSFRHIVLCCQLWLNNCLL